MNTPTPTNDTADHAVVLIADAFQTEGIEALRSMGCTVHAEPELGTADLPARLAECRPDILLVRSTRVDRACIDACVHARVHPGQYPRKLSKTSFFNKTQKKGFFKRLL